MKERPILFSNPMVRAILKGRKTQTRRVVKNNQMPHVIIDNLAHCPYGRTGDRLWVREAFHQHYEGGVLGGRPCYREAGCIHSKVLGWKPSIHMPRWASRITLEITDVRVERLQDINKEDALSEGLVVRSHNPGGVTGQTSPRSIYCLSDADEGGYPNWKEAFENLWDSINAKRGYSWEGNPWVWVVEFQQL